MCRKVSLVDFFLCGLIVLSLEETAGFSNGADPRGIEKIIRSIQRETLELVDIWSVEIGKRLTDLSETITRQEQVKHSFKNLENHLVKITGHDLIEEVAGSITELMAKKAEGVQRIAEYAEFLSYYRNNDSMRPIDKYFFYDSDEIKFTEENETRSIEIEDEIFTRECHWMCYQIHLKNLDQNIYDNKTRYELFRSRSLFENNGRACNCSNPPVMFPLENWEILPMKHDLRFNEKINLDVSAVKVAANVYERDPVVMEAIHWSEPLDMIFKQNFIDDPELTWQYFASPLGLMRHYPAVKWSDEQYLQTYDFRTRSWYTEAMTSPKDIIILLDKSGSMKGTKRALSMQIVNNILDTLNDNDFVNIYTFTNYTRPLVNCFNDTLFQANEENLRLLRENLPVYDLEFVADLSVGLQKGFEILKNFRLMGTSSKCNQAIMLITEGIDYYYDISIFNYSNWAQDFPVRIFTYQIGAEETDEKHMEFIACSNMGYYVNISVMSDIREKILNYLNVMSRPINLNYQKRQVPIWSYLYVDLADRRLSNWLWRKYEGIRQREVFLDHVQRRVERLQLQFSTLNHMLLTESHEFEKYEKRQDYKYMTTVSLPVYGRRNNEFDLIGVAGIDVPIKLLKSRIAQDKIGVNGYAFIITNNGYILMHPEHRTEFEGILKPTFNRADFLETEILDDEREPRLFGEEIVKLREQMLNRQGKEATLKIKYTLDDMRRIVRATTHYYFREVGPFTLCIVLPNGYGFVKVNRQRANPKLPDPTPEFIVDNKNWVVHPDWIYCKNCPHTITDPIRKVEYAYFNPSHRTSLYHDVMYDIDVTQWFDDPIPDEDKFVDPYLVHKVFISTASGLTRFKFFNSDIFQNVYDEAEPAYDKSVDEDWYQRSVEENTKNGNMFLYSVPFEISGYENNTMIRGTKAIFVEKGGLKTPVAVVGLQFNHQAMFKLYETITRKSNKRRGERIITCVSEFLECFILDNNAYIVLSDEIEYTGRFLGDIKPGIMNYLVQEKVYEATRMFDYQAICQLEPPEAPAPDKCNKPKSNSVKITSLFQLLINNVVHLLSWLLSTVLFLIKSVTCATDEVIKAETKAFETLMIKKTFPTPCDRQMWLYTLKDNFRPTFFDNDTAKFSCNWPYVARKIPNTNLLFLAINGKCGTENSFTNTPEPTPIIYNVSLPCYIATMNNYTRKPYMNCYKKHEGEAMLNKKTYYCGHTWN
ncbi:voltage-dependent calcium channel subunit alpha-2/delta-3-like [Cylas formicarius]|uniref:voltage-dependent calcium channel subunit alpha-2/delta-3-like n=1 Tax=Cylas formicarius TaxID=197179 RepID=UPI0029584D76|nr:voltage-dependent calcium channel subunit alpha-2/delta-3-like [Cylas formicarius]